MPVPGAVWVVGQGQALELRSQVGMLLAFESLLVLVVSFVVALLVKLVLGLVPGLDEQWARGVVFGQAMCRDSSSAPDQAWKFVLESDQKLYLFQIPVVDQEIGQPQKGALGPARGRERLLYLVMVVQE